MNSITQRGLLTALVNAGRDWSHTEGPRLVFVIKTLLAGFGALWLAYRLGLGAPQTALTTVFLLALPSTGMVLEKAFYRLGGTLAGSVAAVALCGLLVQQPVLLFVGLALWVGLCTSGAALFRNQQSYSFLLAGYTAVIILVPAISTPNDVFLIAVTRLTEVSLGVLCSAFVSDAVLPRRQGPQVLLLAHGRYQRFLRFCHDVLEAKLSGADIELGHLRFAADVAALESGRAAAWFETAHGRTDSRALRAFNAAFMDTLTTFYGLHRLLQRLRRHPDDAAQPAIMPLVATLYRHAAGALRDTPDAAWLSPALRQLRHDLAGMRRHSARLAPALRLELDSAAELLGRFLLHVSELQAHYRNLTQPQAGPNLLALPHLPYAPATPPWLILASGGRAAAALLILVAAWYWLAWPAAPSAILMASIFCGLSSASPRPNAAVRQILGGFVLGWPLALGTMYGMVVRADGWPMLVLALLPLTTLAAYLISDPKRAGVGVGMGLFATQIIVPPDQRAPDPALFLNTSTALVIGVALASLMFALLLPRHTVGQKDHVARALWRQAARTCVARLDGLKHVYGSRVRDLLNQLNNAAGASPDAAHLAVVRQALTLLELGQAVIDLRRLLAVTRAGRTRAALQRCVERMGSYLRAPGRASHGHALAALDEAGPAVRAARRRAVRSGEQERPLRLAAALADVHALQTALLDQLPPA